MGKFLLEVLNIGYNLWLWFAIIPIIIISAFTLGICLDQIGKFFLGKHWERNWTSLHND